MGKPLMSSNDKLDLDAWLKKLEAIHPSEIDLGLERINEVFLKLIADSNDGTDAKAKTKSVAKKVVTVAGTNGKGSTVKVLESLLLAHGLTVGTYTSPHFIHYNERVSINGVNCADQVFVESFERIDLLRGETSLTYFEFGTLAALDIISRAQVDVAILEVGLGGRLDAVNIVDADIGVVTSIGLDHEDWLGSDLEQIGREKAGIFRSEAAAICGENLPASVAEQANAIEAKLYTANDEFGYTQDSGGGVWYGASSLGQRVEYPNLPISSLPANSVSIALQAFHLLVAEAGKNVVGSVISQCTLQGRCEIISEDPLVVADVAHNPQAANYLANFLRRNEIPGGKRFSGKVIGIAGMLADKDCSSVFTELSSVICDWYLTSLDVPRGRSAADLARHLKGTANVVCCNNMQEAFDKASELAEQNDCILVFGSFFTVAELYAALDRRELGGSVRG